MKTKRFNLKNLKNNAWFQFFTDFKTLVERYDPKVLDIEQLFAVFVTLYADADEAILLIRKSTFSEKLAEADSARDTTFRGFADAAKSFLNHFNAEKRDAAKRIQVVLDRYGNVARLPVNEETSAIYNLLQEMRGTYAADITLLGLTDWVNELEAKNTAYETLARSRDAELSERTTLRMKNVREEADANYSDILDRIDAFMLINGEEAWLPFVREQHALTDRFK